MIQARGVRGAENGPNDSSGASCITVAQYKKIHARFSSSYKLLALILGLLKLPGETNQKANTKITNFSMTSTAPFPSLRAPSISSIT